MTANTAIGIDLGTTYSCVGALQHGKVEIIANEQGSRTTPSCVAFSATERLVGDAARAQAALNPRNTVFDAKRLIGRKFDDPKVQEDLKHWPFQVVDDGGNPKIQVEYKGNTLCFTPEEISSMILSKMKSFAEAYLDEEVKEAVITVPAYFNDAQRQATKDAGTIAGLSVMRIINEPTAAALAYGLEKDLTGERNVLIFDLGGGTFDVSILKITEGSHFEVKSTAGDTHLGGEDFNNKLVEFFACQFERKHKKDLRHSPKALYRLRTAAERAKRTLSTSTEASIDIDSLFDGIDFVHKISRARFEELNFEFFNSTLVQVENALKDAKLDKSDIHDIVLVGGSTRIPKVQSILQNYFNGKKLNLSINPDEAVAYGATVQAAILTGVGEAKIQDLVLVDVLPLSLGVETLGGIMSKIIERNTQIPCKTTQTYTPCIDDQTAMDIIIFEGERAMTKDNEKLGSFLLPNIPPAPRGHENIDVCFYINSDSILQVSAKVKSTGEKAQITIEHNKGRLSQAQIQRMVADAKRYQYEDNLERERVDMKNKLENYVYQVKHALVNKNNKLKKDDDCVIRNKCEEVIRWLDNNATADKEDFEDKMKKLKDYCDPFMKNINGAGPKTRKSPYDIEEVD